MTHEDYRAIISQLGLSQAGASRFLGVNEVTSRRWATNKQTVPEPVARFLRLLVAAKISPEKAAKLLKL
jgi:DNA-binding transcriptional regulator YiaG